MTLRRAVPIRKVLLAGYTSTQLQTYLRWVFLSEDRWPGWMRKEGRDYTETENLFRVSHLRDHLQEAETWAGGEISPTEPTWAAFYGDRVYTG